MTPTAELRWVVRRHPSPFENDGEILSSFLQQKWVQHHIPAGQTEAPFEWRDVPVVDEQEGQKNG